VQVAIGTNDVYKSAEAVDLATKELVGGKILWWCTDPGVWQWCTDPGTVHTLQETASR
jgi:hypothetical protein